MARYPGWYTTEQVCKLECMRTNAILIRHKVPKERRREILDAIKQGYCQLQTANEFNKHFIKFVCDYFGISENALTKTFLRYETREISENQQKRGRGK